MRNSGVMLQPVKLNKMLGRGRIMDDNREPSQRLKTQASGCKAIANLERSGQDLTQGMSFTHLLTKGPHLSFWGTWCYPQSVLRYPGLSIVPSPMFL